MDSKNNRVTSTLPPKVSNTENRTIKISNTQLYTSSPSLIMLCASSHFSCFVACVWTNAKCVRVVIRRSLGLGDFVLVCEITSITLQWANGSNPPCRTSEDPRCIAQGWSSSLLTHIKHLLRSKAPSTTTDSPFLQIFSVKLCLDCFFLFSHLNTVKKTKKRLWLFHPWAPDPLCSLYHLPMLAFKPCREVAYHVNIIFLAFPICRIATETIKLPGVLINV